MPGADAKHARCGCANQTNKSNMLGADPPQTQKHAQGGCANETKNVRGSVQTQVHAQGSIAREGNPHSHL